MPCIVADIIFCNFAGCSALASIECSSWDTSSVTDMSGMFFCCLLLSAANVSSWDVSRVTSCDRMFAGCSKLGDIDVSGWNTSSMKSASEMFARMDSFRSLALKVESFSILSLARARRVGWLRKWAQVGWH